MQFWQFPKEDLKATSPPNCLPDRATVCSLRSRPDEPDAGHGWPVGPTDGCCGPIHTPSEPPGRLDVRFVVDWPERGCRPTQGASRSPSPGQRPWSGTIAKHADRPIGLTVLGTAWTTTGIVVPLGRQMVCFGVCSRPDSCAGRVSLCQADYLSAARQR